MTVLRHWLEADEKPRCQHCPCLADERSFMCEDCAGQADEEAQTLRDQLAGAVEALRAVWGDMRGLDKEHVPSDVLDLVRVVLGDELGPHDPASTRGR